MVIRKTKRTIKRRAKAGHSPIPKGVGCGHECEGSCRVRHCGPTSHIRDHHAHSASRSVSHIWMATIVTGVAIVLTGALALGAVQADDGLQANIADSSQAEILDQIQRLNYRLMNLESTIVENTEACTAQVAE